MSVVFFWVSTLCLVVRSSEMLATTYKTTWYLNPEDHHFHCYENLKSQILFCWERMSFSHLYLQNIISRVSEITEILVLVNDNLFQNQVVAYP